MVDIQYFLLILSICALSHGQLICGSTFLGRKSTRTSITSRTSLIPAGYRVVQVVIPNGNVYACEADQQLVGQEVFACDWYSPPIVRYAKYTIEKAIVTRTGPIQSLQQPASTYTIYHCDKKTMNSTSDA